MKKKLLSQFSMEVLCVFTMIVYAMQVIDRQYDLRLKATSRSYITGVGSMDCFSYIFTENIHIWHNVCLRCQGDNDGFGLQV